MRTDSLFGTVAVLVGLLLGTILPARAMPGFARKYGFTCTMCHSSFPRLNDFGERYRANAYQIPGRESDDRTVLAREAPFAMRTSAGFNHDDFQDTPGSSDMSLMQVNGLDILSGGVLGRDKGFFLVFPPQIAESRSVAAQEGTIEMANVFLGKLGSSWLNARVGRFEPAFAAFSVKRHLSFTSYEIYDYTFQGGPGFSDTQDGIELTGRGNPGLSYAAGWLDGSATNLLDDVPRDGYARIAKVFGAGEGQTAGQRIGATGYAGKARPTGVQTCSSGCLRSFYRAGVDASLNYAQANLALQFLYGKDAKELWGSDKDATYTGGFGELSYMPATMLVGFARIDLVRAPDFDRRDIRRGTIGARGYLEDNLAVHAEYSYRLVKAGKVAVEDSKENFATIRIDWAF